MAFTPRSKLLGATVAAVVVVGGLSYANYTNTKEIAKLESNPVVVTHTVVVTPTVAPTATPAASLKVRIFTPAKATNTVTKGVK